MTTRTDRNEAEHAHHEAERLGASIRWLGRLLLAVGIPAVVFACWVLAEAWGLL